MLVSKIHCVWKKVWTPSRTHSDLHGLCLRMLECSSFLDVNTLQSPLFSFCLDAKFLYHVCICVATPSDSSIYTSCAWTFLNQRWIWSVCRWHWSFPMLRNRSLQAWTWSVLIVLITLVLDESLFLIGISWENLALLESVICGFSKVSQIEIEGPSGYSESLSIVDPIALSRHK